MKVVKASLVPRRPLNMLVYGPPGCGKTTFAATAPGVVIIDFERKAEKTLREKYGDTPLLSPTATDELADIVDYCLEQKYQTVCIDTIDRLFSALMTRLLSKLKRYHPEIQHWGIIMDEIKREVIRLQNANCNCLLLSHETEERVKDPVSKENIVNIRPNIPTKLRNDVPAIVDIVGYMGKPRLDKGMNCIWVKGPENCNWYCKSAWNHPGGTIYPNFAQLLSFVNPPAPAGVQPAAPTAAPSTPSIGNGKKLLDLLQELHAQATGETSFLEFDEDLRAMLEARYGVPVTTELSEEQAHDLVRICTEDLTENARLRNIRDSIIAIWKNRHAANS